MSPGVTIDGRGHRLSGTGTRDDNAGIFVNNIPDVTVKNLRVSGWGYGIYYYDQGVSLGRVEGCTIENNLFAGVVLYNKVHGVSVAGNRITGNVGRGVWIADATDNVIYDNWFSNPGDNADVAGTSTGNAFTVVKRAGPNILGGLWIGGNYWAKPDGRGFSQTHADGNGDGFSDEVFTFSGHVDSLPLTSLAPTPTPGPYRTLVVPGTLEAEDYDNGGEGVAYHDTVAGNQGGAYRSDDVDIEAITGGYTLAYIRDTEWTRYTVTVQQAGDYRVGLRAAAWNGPRTVRILAGTTEIGTVTVPVTGSDDVCDDGDHGPPRGRHPDAPVRLYRRRDEPGPDRDRARHADGHPDSDPDGHGVPQAPYPSRARPPRAGRGRALRRGRRGRCVPRLRAREPRQRPARGPARASTSRRAAGSPTSASSVPASSPNYSVDASHAGSFEMTLRAANPDAVTKAVTVYVDGVPAGEVPVGPTGGWTTYSNFVTSSPSPRAATSVTLAFEDVDRLNLDRLGLAQAGPSPTPTVNATETATPRRHRR